MTNEELELEWEKYKEFEEFKSETKALESPREVIEIENVAVRQTGTEDKNGSGS
jgi:hypothetical protein